MKSFKVSNFRLFDEKGAAIDLRPVTVLTGANSSGKSSFVKALVAFSDYTNPTLGDYRRDGSYNPISHKLDLFRPELKLSGFSGVKNRNADKESPVSYTREFYPTPSLFGPYVVKHSFNIPVDEHNDIMDHGQLTAIDVSVVDSDFVRLSYTKDGFKIDYLNLNGNIMLDFLAFCRFCLIPYTIQEDSHDRIDGSYNPDYCDDKGNFSIEKTAQTELGKLLAKIQGKDIADYRYASVAGGISDNIKREYKSLFACTSKVLSFATAIDKCSQFGLIFYFPLFDNLVNKDKQEAIAYINDSFKCGFISSYLGGDIKKLHFKEDLKLLLDDFEQSEYDSFIEYFRSLENYVLENVNSEKMTFRTAGRSYNFIEDEILQRADIAFDSNGFSNRKKEETLFSLAYKLLSIWQWEETRDYTHGSFEDGSLIRDDDLFIERYINQRYFDYSSRHILYSAYLDYIKFVLKESLITDELYRLQYNTNSFTSVQRLHSFEENSQFVRIMKEYVQVRERVIRDSKLAHRFIHSDEEMLYVPDTFLNKWLRQDGLNICDHIELNTTRTDGLGFMIELVDANGNRESLADLGHGITQIISILIQIECVILQNQYSNTERLNGNACPPAIIAMEEPEISLHPCLQSLLADVLYDAAVNYGETIYFLVETHSEYLVRKIQAIVSDFSDSEFAKKPFGIYYFNPKGKEEAVYEMCFSRTGRFENSFGEGFFDEAARSKYKVLKKEEELYDSENESKQ